MDLALGVALGSSIQIALCVLPVCVLAAWACGQPLSLDFGSFETILLIVAVLVVNSTIAEGSTTWLEGAMLVVSYVIIAVAYFFVGDNSDTPTEAPTSVNRLLLHTY